MDFVLKMMDFVLKNDDFGATTGEMDTAESVEGAIFLSVLAIFSGRFSFFSVDSHDVTTAGLSAVLRGRMIRRLKDDVFKNGEVGAKEETIIWVELTAKQKEMYRGLLDQKRGALTGKGDRYQKMGVKTLEFCIKNDGILYSK